MFPEGLRPPMSTNRRCFVLKVVAPLCQISTLRILRVNWTNEFDAKLGQCPQLDAWATDQPNVEAVTWLCLMTLKVIS